MRSILDRNFKYTSSFDTNIQRRFRSIERAKKAAAEAGAVEYDSWFWYLKPAASVTQLKVKGAAK